MSNAPFGGERISGFGSVHDAPELPAGFTDMFESYRIKVQDIRLHVVIGGEGPPLLLLAGWPECWYAWHALMPALARNFTLIVPDPRGSGLSDNPERGYDGDTMAGDMFALMDGLGHTRFAMVGHDIGEWTAFAMASLKPERIVRLAIGEAMVPGVSPSPPLVSDDRQISDFLWHKNFNRAREVNERLVSGREEIYFGHQFASKAASPDAVPAHAQQFYIQLMRDPANLRSSFEYYRDLDLTIPQNKAHVARGKWPMPVLTFAGAWACGDLIAQEIATMADDLTSVVVPECGHFVPEEKPAALLAALEPFLEPYARGES
jgi:pimeloyl-ACP methyl ester carboxylesterase